MMLKKWDDLPDFLRTEEVRPYYDVLVKRQADLFIKRVFDLVVSFFLIVLFLPIFLILSLMICLDSKGPAIFKQKRVTQYGKPFYIYKFRTMVQNADKMGAQVTTSGDSRVTRVGKWIRRCRLDEVCQLLNVLNGTMTFVGTRPEVPKYVDRYTNEMMATLLLPAGITSQASIQFKDEERLLTDAQNVDETYTQVVLPQKMQYNLDALRRFSFFGEIKLLFKTVAAVLKRE